MRLHACKHGPCIRMPSYAHQKHLTGLQMELHTHAATNVVLTCNAACLVCMTLEVTVGVTISAFAHAKFSRYLTMYFLVHRFLSLYFGNTFHLATETSTDFTILFDTTCKCSSLQTLHLNKSSEAQHQLFPYCANELLHTAGCTQPTRLHSVGRRTGTVRFAAGV